MGGRFKWAGQWEEKGEEGLWGGIINTKMFGKFV